MEKKKIGDGLVGTLQKAADTAKAVKMVAQDMAADAKKSRKKKKSAAKGRGSKSAQSSGRRFGCEAGKVCRAQSQAHCK